MVFTNAQHRPGLASCLRDTRASAGLSLRELARRAATSHPTLLAYEQGKKVPSVAVYMRILEACGYAVDLHLHPRVRDRDGLARGEELQQVLELAEQFPVRLERRMGYPRFGST